MNGEVALKTALSAAREKAAPQLRGLGGTCHDSSHTLRSWSGHLDWIASSAESTDLRSDVSHEKPSAWPVAKVATESFNQRRSRASYSQSCRTHLAALTDDRLANFAQRVLPACQQRDRIVYFAECQAQCLTRSRTWTSVKQDEHCRSAWPPTCMHATRVLSLTSAQDDGERLAGRHGRF